MSNCVALILRTHKRFERWRSRLPHWGRDLLGLVSYINVLGLIPTVVPLALAPRHFFRRLPLILDGKKKGYRTPIKFFTNAGSLFVLLFFLRNPDIEAIISPGDALWAMLLLIPLTPVLMACLAVVLWVAYQLPRLIPAGQPFPQPNPHLLGLALSPAVFRALDKPLFFWGLFYISLYFVTAWQLAQLLVIGALSALNLLFGTFATEQGLAEAILLIVAVVCLALAIHWLVYRPYAEMLRGCLKTPVEKLFRADTYAMKVEVDDFLRVAGKQPTEQQINSLVLALEFPLERLERTLLQQNVDYRQVPEQALFRNRRREVIQAASRREEIARLCAATADLAGETAAQVDDLLARLERLENRGFR